MPKLERVFRGTNMKKKIGLFLSTEPHGGGKYQYTQSMLHAVESLPADKYSIVVAFTSSAWERRIAHVRGKKLYVPDGFCRWFFDRVWRNSRLPISLWHKISPSFYSLSRRLIREKCDLWIFPAEDTVTYQIDVPALCTIYDLMHRYESRFPEVGAYGRARRRDRHYREICKYAKGILVDSTIGKQHLMESYGVSENMVHELPYVAPPYMYSCQEDEAFDSRYQLPSKFIFYPAQFWEHKNHKRLVEAVARLKPKHPDIRLVLVGSKKNAYQSVVQLTENLGLNEQIVFLGYVPDEDMSGIYRRARALIMPTFFGPTNIPPLEALCTGCPVAVSDIYGMPEQVGDAALLFDPSSTEQIAHSIEMLWCGDALCDDLRSKGLRQAHLWKQEQFDERLENIISNVI